MPIARAYVEDMPISHQMSANKAADEAPRNDKKQGQKQPEYPRAGDECGLVEARRLQSRGVPETKARCA